MIVSGLKLERGLLSKQYGLSKSKNTSLLGLNARINTLYQVRWKIWIFREYPDTILEFFS
ncbi:MAG: hypothetical protein CMI18_07070 [Opitutaceae bacterium]|nr:hypothetical protein [Opitutaceae bacterium]